MTGTRHSPKKIIQNLKPSYTNLNTEFGGLARKHLVGVLPIEVLCKGEYIKIFRSSI
jgi:hypothetical protein